MPWRGKSCLYNHFGEAEALFYYVNIQGTSSAGRGLNHSKFFNWGHCSPTGIYLLQGTITSAVQLTSTKIAKEHDSLLNN